MHNTRQTPTQIQTDLSWRFETQEADRRICGLVFFVICREHVVVLQSYNKKQLCVNYDRVGFDTSVLERGEVGLIQHPTEDTASVQQLRRSRLLVVGQSMICRV